MQRVFIASGQIHRANVKAKLSLACGVLLLGAAHGAHAQFAVIDVASLTQLIGEAQTLAQQLEAARVQIAQAQTLYQSMTGSRGMQQLLDTTALNYLPSDWTQLMAVMQGGSAGYSTLSGSIASAVAGNAVLSPSQLASLSSDEQASIMAERQSVALLQGVAQQALSTSSDRFGDIQQLIGAIPTASDQKSMLELQAAIGTEMAVLENERTKLQVLYQASESEERANRQRVRELVVAGHGQFTTRFEPTPP